MMKVLILVGSCVALLGATACGGADDGARAQPDEQGAGVDETADDGDEFAGVGDKACLEGPHDGRKVSVVAEDFRFRPRKIEAKAGETITLHFETRGTTPHSFTLGDPACDTDPLFSGESARATFVVGEDDTKFVCTVHRNMTGELLVGT